MEAKYLQAIKSGLIGSVIIGFCIILMLIINVISAASTVSDMWEMLNCCNFIFIVLLMVGLGAFGVRMASAHIVTLRDALAVSAVAGAAAGTIAGIVYAICLIVKPLLVYDPAYDINGMYGFSPSSTSALGGILGICCCWPGTLVITVVLAAIGGAIYAVAIQKIK